MAEGLIIKNLVANIAGQEILKGVDLTVSPGEVHCIMGPNGSGKSTLTKVAMGHPQCEVISGTITYNGVDVLALEPDERSRMGIFLAFQYPQEVAGVNFLQYLTAIYNVHLKQKDPEASAIKSFRLKRQLEPYLQELKMNPDFLDRFLNAGFSGGEKKKAEILQLKLIDPALIMLDETDSGLDVDALRIVAEGVQNLLSPEKAVLMVTHYRRILNYIKPDKVHVMHNGKIIKSGEADLAHELEERGYEWLIP